MLSQAARAAEAGYAEVIVGLIKAGAVAFAEYEYHLHIESICKLIQSLYKDLQCTLDHPAGILPALMLCLVALNRQQSIRGHMGLLCCLRLTGLLSVTFFCNDGSVLPSLL